jgi:hypothetical protein
LAILNIKNIQLDFFSNQGKIIIILEVVKYILQ